MFATAVNASASSVQAPKRTRIDDTTNSQEDVVPIDV